MGACVGNGLAGAVRRDRLLVTETWKVRDSWEDRCLVSFGVWLPLFVLLVLYLVFLVLFAIFTRVTVDERGQYSFLGVFLSLYLGFLTPGF